jgi:Na+-translocating ferredoxin:NAD+ oxidoreductase RnfG subunit
VQRLFSISFDMRHSVILLALFFMLSMGVSNLMGQRPALRMDHKAVGREIAKVYGNPHFSLESIAVDNATPSKNDLYSKVLLGNEHAGFVYLGRVNSCRAGGCDISGANHNNETSEYFDFIILFDTNARIKVVKVINYQATHGQEIASKGWLKQFVGFDGDSEKQVGKDVDAISGATISVYAITYRVNESSRRLAQLVN